MPGFAFSGFANKPSAKACPPVSRAAVATQKALFTVEPLHSASPASDPPELFSLPRERCGRILKALWPA
jgi:hypothetical protein